MWIAKSPRWLNHMIAWMVANHHKSTIPAIVCFSKPTHTHKKSEQTWQTYADLFGTSIDCFSTKFINPSTLQSAIAATLNWPPSDFENVAEQCPFPTKAWEGDSVQILCDHSWTMGWHGQHTNIKWMSGNSLQPTSTWMYEKCMHGPVCYICFSNGKILTVQRWCLGGTHLHIMP